MKIFKRSVYSLLAMLAFANIAQGADYGFPANIQQGNILHCFNWPASAVKAALPQIAASGFATVQLSPLQRGDIREGSSWHDLYRPYDLAFKSSSYCSEQDLRDLCSAAAEYGIKIIVDVVANHVDKTAGYHDTWWDSGGRVRWEGGIDYGNRYSITHGQLGDYGDVNSELSEVAARGKAYVEKLKSLGVKGCRWDAAKHIGLPSEGCNFWREVTSVPGMFHYGEILDNPGPNASIITEYGTYMSVTDNEYCNYAAKSNGGIPGGYGGSWAVNYNMGDKCIYWAESHDTYSNDEWSQNVDQSIIDRAYAAYACRNDAAALYLARPNAKGFSNIKVGKGSTAFTAKHIAEVNKFRNAMVGRKDYFDNSPGNACSITREGGGAVIVMKGSGNVSVKNGGGYCPAGTYTDKVSGSTFTVTATTISGNVGSSGIAVLIKDGAEPPHGDDPIIPPVEPDGDMWILGNLEGAAGWATTPGTGAAMTLTDGKYVANGVKFVAATGETKCYFNITDYVGASWDDLNMNANRYGAATEGAPITLGTPATVVKYANNVDASGCLSWTIPAGTYDLTFDPSSMQLTVVNAGDNPPINPPVPTTLTIQGDYNLAYNGDLTKVHYWGGDAPSAWPGIAMTTAVGSDGNTYKVAKIDPTSTSCLFHTNQDADKTADLVYKAGYVMSNSGPTNIEVKFTNGGDDPIIPPVEPTDFTIYYDNSATGWTNVSIHYWTTPSTNWPGTAMTKVEGDIWKYTFTSDPSGLKGFLFDDGSGSGDANQTADFEGAPTKNHLYKGAGGNKGAVTDEGEYNVGPQPTKPVVTASPASGTMFDENLTVTLTVAPAADIYYTLDGSTPTTSSTRYSAPIYFESTTTIKTLAVTSEGGKNEQSFSYRKRSHVDPTPGNNIITDYYKVNPDGQVGRYRTVNAVYEKLNNDNRMCVAKNALSNWTSQDLIAQGVGRDIASAIRGKHEYPVVDSYAIYAAYDDNNLYLGIQYVYSTWDLYGDGILSNFAASPYNMDGRLIIAMDLDPEKSFDGVLANGNTIWDADGQYTVFNNGTDCALYCSTKSTVGQPSLFFPTPDGHASYDAPYCVGLDAPFYGCQNGLLPSIDHIWAQAEFGYDPEMLKTNDGFVDIKGECNDDQHTFYEFTLPLSKLGITKQWIESNGIGVMAIDTYGQGATGSTPYDPCVLDNASVPYSKDESSSHEKEDKDIFTYDFARIGKLKPTVGVDCINSVEISSDAPVYFNLQGVEVQNPEAGVYIVRRGNKLTKEVIR